MNVLALTPGDPSGIGLEITLKLLAELPVGEPRPLVFGDRRLLEQAADALGIAPAWVPIAAIEDLERLKAHEVGWVEVPWTHPERPAVGEVSRESGEYAYRVLEAVAPWLVEGRVAGVVTGPICKEAIQLTRPEFIGHTEFFAQLAGTERFGMLLVVEPLRALHVTTHVAIADVPRLLTPERITRTLDLAVSSLALLGEPEGQIAVCALNPHAGEAGHFGDEELTVIAPTVKQARARGWNVVGPLPPDTVFNRALAGEFAIVVCMYHDQGHIPLKLFGFERGINVTVGLPFVRTSVDHGTAFDLAGTGRAKASSLRAAWDLAGKISSRDRPATGSR